MILFIGMDLRFGKRCGSVALLGELPYRVENKESLGGLRQRKRCISIALTVTREGVQNDRLCDRWRR